MFNHESPRRGETFVTRKITRAVSRIILGLQEVLTLGNLNSKRDWGFAPEYCEGMWRILQHDVAEDFVLATGVTKTVKEFIDFSFKHLGITLAWKGEGVDEVGVIDSISTDSVSDLLGSKVEDNHYGYCCSPDLKPGKIVVKVNPTYYRPTEVDLLIGDPAKAKRVLGWEAKTQFEELVRLMVQADLKLVLEKGA